jgi:hypothetical protein
MVAYACRGGGSEGPREVVREGEGREVGGIKEYDKWVPELVVSIEYEI